MAKKEKPYSGRSGAAARASGRSLAIDKPSIQARKSAAQSMQRAGVQSLSGLSGSQGQVARFKAEQNNLRNEYNNKNTSDDRKEEIVKDLRGVSRDLNDQSRAAALNQVIREFGPGSVTNTGGIMGSDAGARFNELRGDFVSNQGAFKTGDKNLFKQVHPNPLKVLLGAATQAGNISPLGLVRNINKIRTGQPLIDMSFMDRNISESPSRMKDFYSAYMEGMNKKIADLKSSKNADQFDAVPLDPQFQNVGEEPLDYGAQIANEIFSEDPTGDPSNREDLQDEIDKTIFNQYSLLQDPNLADTLLDDTEETDLAEEINPDEEEQEYNEMIAGMPFDRPDYEQEFIDTFGVPMKGNIEVPSISRPEEMERGLGDRLTRERFALDNNIPLDQLGEVYPKITRYPTKDMGTYTVYDDSSLFDADQLYDGETGIPYDTVFSDKISDTPKVGQEIRGFNINNPSLMPGGDSNIYLGYPGGIGLNDVENMVNTVNRKDGGSVNTYDVLKLINDTMNDG